MKREVGIGPSRAASRRRPRDRERRRPFGRHWTCRSGKAKGPPATRAGAPRAGRLALARAGPAGMAHERAGRSRVIVWTSPASKRDALPMIDAARRRAGSTGRTPTSMPTPMPDKVPTTVITGFLGAGKTTLIRHLLENAGGRRIALIINEFGDLGVDGEILAGCGIEACDADDMIELSNGCICCTVADDFIPAMTSSSTAPSPPTISSSRPPASRCRSPWSAPSTGPKSAPG